MRIGHKSILGFVGIALLVGVVGYLAVDTSQKVLQKSIGESSVSLAVKVLDEIDKSIYNRIERFQICSKDVMVREVVKNSNQEFKKLDDIQNYINKKDAEWASAPKEETTPFMQELMNNKLSEELREKIEFYEEKYGYRVFGEIFITNKYGTNAAQTGKTSDYYQADEEWWQMAKKEGSYVGDVEYDESADVYSTAIGMRIDDESGNFIGVIKAVLNVEEVIDIMKKAEATKKRAATEFKLITKNRKIIYSTEESNLFENVSEELFSRFEQKGEDIGYFIAEGDKTGEGEELFAHAHSKGYRDYKGLGWILIVEHKAEEVFAPVARLKNSILIISTAATALAILIGFFISHSISRPVSKLISAIIEIGKGGLDTRVEVESNDEIGKLAQSFNEMTHKLKDYHANLEKKVKERTSELSSANTKLEDEVTERSSAQESLQGHIKQLDCLYKLSKLIERPKISLEQIFQETAELIRSTHQHPDITSVRITFNGIHYKTDNFEKSELSQYAQINVHGDKDGNIEVYYLGEKTEDGQDPFIKEERDLLDAIAEHLGRMAERTQTGKKLELFRNLIDRSNDCIFVMESEWGRFLDANDRACTALGYTREELLNMAIKDIEESIPDDSSWQEHIKELKLKGDIIMEGRHRRKDATTFFVEATLKLVSQEKKDYIIAITRDVTERKQAEEATALAYRKLEEANKELKEMQSQLVQSEKLASIGQLAAGVAHEMNTPVGFIASNFQTLEDYVKKFRDLLGLYNELTGGIEASEKMELLKKANAISQSRDDMKMDFVLEDIQGLFDDSREGLSRVTNIIQNLRDFSRVDQAEEFDEYDINAGIEATLVVARNEIKYDADIKTDFSKMPHVYCSASQINQVFLNLLVNASQAIKSQEKEGKGTITIKTYATDDQVVCEISDDGCGIPPESLPKIFDPFFTTKPVGSGTGLGLSVSYDIIVSKHKGEILADSTVGEGSKFTIKLPIKKEETSNKQETDKSSKNIEVKT